MRRGSVLVAVLIMVAFLVSFAVLIYDKSSGSYMGITGIQADNQGAVYAGTALKIVENLMDLENSDYDAMTDEWAMLPSIPVTGGYVAIQVRPADDRLPINGLANTDSAISERVQNAFDTVFEELDIDANLWRSMYDWVNEADAEPLSMYLKDEVYNASGNGYKAKNEPIASLHEIRLIPGIPQVYNELAAHLCVGDIAPKININFADELTIRAFLPELASNAEQIVQVRNETPFRKKDDLYMLLGSGSVDIYNAVLPFFDVKSSYFYVKLEVNILENTRYYHALFQRVNRKMILIRYIEGHAVNYF